VRFFLYIFFLFILSQLLDRDNQNGCFLMKIEGRRRK